MKLRDLPETDQRELIAKIIHVLNNEGYFDAITYLVEEAESAGVFSNVKFHPNESETFNQGISEETAG